MYEEMLRTTFYFRGLMRGFGSDVLDPSSYQGMDKMDDDMVSVLNLVDDGDRRKDVDLASRFEE